MPETFSLTAALVSKSHKDYSTIEGAITILSGFSNTTYADLDELLSNIIHYVKQKNQLPKEIILVISCILVYYLPTQRFKDLSLETQAQISSFIFSTLREFNSNECELNPLYFCFTAIVAEMSASIFTDFEKASGKGLSHVIRNLILLIVWADPTHSNKFTFNEAYFITMGALSSLQQIVNNSIPESKALQNMYKFGLLGTLFSLFKLSNTNGKSKIIIDKAFELLAKVCEKNSLFQKKSFIFNPSVFLSYIPSNPNDSQIDYLITFHFQSLSLNIDSAKKIEILDSLEKLLTHPAHTRRLECLGGMANLLKTPLLSDYQSLKTLLELRIIYKLEVLTSAVVPEIGNSRSNQLLALNDLSALIDTNPKIAPPLLRSTITTLENYSSSFEGSGSRSKLSETINIKLRRLLRAQLHQTTQSPKGRASATSYSDPSTETFSAPTQQTRSNQTTGFFTQRGLSRAQRDYAKKAGLLNPSNK